VSAALAAMLLATHPAPLTEAEMRQIGVGILAVGLVGCGTFDFEPGDYLATGGPRDGEVIALSSDEDLLDAIRPSASCEADSIDAAGEADYTVRFVCDTFDMTTTVHVTGDSCILARHPFDPGDRTVRLEPVVLADGRITEMPGCPSP
jgi:hypothetical protein